MAARRRFRLFTDDSNHLDRFGAVLVLSALSVTILSLVDLDDPTATLSSELSWLVVTFIVGITLIVVVRVSGVARRPRIVVDVVFGLAIVGVLSIAVLSLTSSAEMPSAVGRPNVLWTLVALISPALVLRRVMMQRDITIQTLFGGLAVYLLLALAFNYAFLALDSGPGSDQLFFGQVESTSSFMYFSLATITTVGYGDLSAVSDFGRFLASAEAVLGQVLLVTVVARLVTMYSRSPERDGQSSDKAAENTEDRSQKTGADS
jgi:hypothetical protein